LRFIQVIPCIRLIRSNILVIEIIFFIVILLVIILVAFFRSDEVVWWYGLRIRCSMIILCNLTHCIDLHATRERSSSRRCGLPTNENCALVGGIRPKINEILVVKLVYLVLYADLLPAAYSTSARMTMLLFQLPQHRILLYLHKISPLGLAQSVPELPDVVSILR